MLSGFDALKEQRRKYNAPIDKNSIQYRCFIKKNSFSIFEFACLMAGLAPWNLNDSYIAHETIERSVRPFINSLLDAIWYDNIIHKVFTEVPVLEGFATVTKNYKNTKTENLCFPFQSFYEFCREREIDFPLPIPEGFVPSIIPSSESLALNPETAPTETASTLATDNQAQSELETLRVQVNKLQQENSRLNDELDRVKADLVEAKTVGGEIEQLKKENTALLATLNGQEESEFSIDDFRKLLNKDHPHYRPGLDMAIRLWLKSENSEKREEVTIKGDLNGLLNDLIFENYPNLSKDEREKYFSRNERNRILTLVNWDKKGTKYQ